MNDKPTPREQEKYAESPAYQSEDRPQYEFRKFYGWSDNDGWGEWIPCSAELAAGVLKRIDAKFESRLAGGADA